MALLYVCRMEIEIQASVQETNTFLQENRPVWPRVPTACLVKECGEKLYSTFKDFLNHWKSVHEVNKILKSCSCGKLFTTAKHLKSHLKNAHNHHQVPDKTVRNQSFRDPQEILPFQLGNKEDRNSMKMIQKHLARQQRKAEADKFIHEREILCSTSTDNICRDERVVERKGKLYKDTNLWDASKLRKRRDFK